MKKVKAEFKVGKDTLRGLIFNPTGKGPFPGVIFFHGSGSSGNNFYESAERLAKKGILSFMFNFRGCGISDGDFSKQTIDMGLEDAKAGFKYYLSLSQLDKERIGVAGSSFGGFLAAIISSDFDFKSIALSVPASYGPDRMNTLHTDNNNALRKDFEKSESYKNISQYKNNLLIIQAELDDILPKGMAEKYIAVANNARKMEHLVLKGVGHRIRLFPKAKAVLLEKLDSWFLETL